MNISNYWIKHFNINATKKRINWNLQPTITAEETANILASLQAWQLGETSEALTLISAAKKYALKVGDAEYVPSIKLFIKEEQKHGENLGRYLDNIGQQRIKKDWGDSLFRHVRHINTSMEMWTLTVIVIESIAQVFYQSLKDATNCVLLKDICDDILIDEAYHITFQVERLAIIYDSKSSITKAAYRIVYRHFFFVTCCVVWLAHKKVFKAGGNSLKRYLQKMSYKHDHTIKNIINHPQVQLSFI